MQHNKIIIYNVLLLTMLLSLTGCSKLPVSEKQNVVSWNKMKWNDINRQKYDYSCGAGALSTLVEFYFRDPAPEEFILEDMLKRMDADTIKDRKVRGFSMQDLKLQAESMGYIALGVELTPEMASQLRGPVIVLLEGQDINHFVVLKGIRYGKVYLADPQRGNIRIAYINFLSQWNRLALVLGKKGFGLPTDHLLGLSQEMSPDWVAPEVDVVRGNQRQLQNTPQAFSRMIFPVINSVID